MAVQILDSFINFLSGLGMARDKSVGSTYFFSPVSQQEIEAAYRSDWIAKKLIEIPAKDATREWRQWQADANQVEVLEEEESRLDLQRKIRTALTWARLYGGAGIVLGTEGNSSQELDVETIKKGGLKFIHVAHRYDLGIGPIIGDLLSPYFGMPEYFSRNIVGATIQTGTEFQIHPSRVIAFKGALAPGKSDFWGDSILQTLMDTVKDCSLVTRTVATLVNEAKIDIIKIPELTENLANSEYERMLTARFSAANRAKSIINTILLDSTEEWNRIDMNFGALPDLIRVFLLLTSGAADIPATRMLGQSPAGLSSTGESDIRNYYDHISSEQENEITPVLSKLDEALIRSALGSRPDSIYYEWRPLWQLSEPEKIAMCKQKADIFQIDANVGLIDPEALRIGRQNQVIEDGLYPGLESALEEQEQLDMESMVHPDDVEEEEPLPAVPGQPIPGQPQPEGEPVVPT